MGHGAIANTKEKGKRSMAWIIFAGCAVLAWGIYGPALHKGQTSLGNPLKALLCVGNVIVSMATHPPKNPPNPLLYLGFLLAVVGAGLVLYYKPS